MDGILVLDKPSGWTSHDVVAKVRRLTQIKRVGHTGTLDPLATGVLVLCLGQATRLVEYLAGHAKRYRATIRLGVETDTYDAQGQTIAQRPVEVSATALRESLATFAGAIEQVPPMYSAIKQDGQRLYDLARKGIEVKRASRRVTIHSIDLLDVNLPDITLEVHCSAGTYIRSLAHDLGERLGCGAHLAALIRTAAGPFTLAQAVTLAQLEAAVTAGAWPALLQPLEAALTAFPSIRLSAPDAARARHGQSLALPEAASLMVEAERIRVYDPAGQLIGVMRLDPSRNELRPEKIFSEQ
ncbi:MAG TPA: tRNA pseudouridine(55) synthase TruB [Anaerolineae bacterium]|nr:tRNA pseudouridine(55) synthase TruB [Anaerolineae bacterium]